MEEIQNTEQSDNSARSVWTVILFLGVLVVLATLYLSLADQPAEDNSTTTIPPTWEQYSNSEFGFSIQYPPSGWEIAANPDAELGPRFAVYKAGTFSEDQTVPPDHFADGVYVGIYPEGIPTEGVLGQATSSEVSLIPSPDDARTYILEDGTPWAVYAIFESPPRAWNSYGFIWARVQIDNLEISCMRDNEEVPQNECEPMMGDVIVRDGQIDEGDWETIRDIISTFRFTQ